MAVNMFDGPIPGQSLTTTPKNAKWEKPPQFTTVDKAMDHLIDRIVTPAILAQLVELIDAGASIPNLANTLLFAGFTEGKWTVDLAFNLVQPIVGLLAVSYFKITGKKPHLENNEPDHNLIELMRMKGDNTSPSVSASKTAEIKKEYKSTGIMGMN